MVLYQAFVCLVTTSFRLLEARKSGNEFGVSAILRKHSPLVSKQRLIKANQGQLALLKTASIATDALVSLCGAGRDPTFFDVLESILKSELFPVPESLRLVVAQKGGHARIGRCCWRTRTRKRGGGRKGVDRMGRVHYDAVLTNYGLSRVRLWKCHFCNAAGGERVGVSPSDGDPR